MQRRGTRHFEHGVATGVVADGMTIHESERTVVDERQARRAGLDRLAGVGHERLDQAMDLIRRIVAGRTVLLIEHNMDVVMQVSHEIVVMVQGQLLASGSPDDVRANSAVRAAYLGEGE